MWLRRSFSKCLALSPAFNDPGDSDSARIAQMCVLGGYFNFITLWKGTMFAQSFHDNHFAASTGKYLCVLQYRILSGPELPYRYDN